jgi:hypothetical protein
MTISKFDMVNLTLADIYFTTSLLIESAGKKAEFNMCFFRDITWYQAILII